MHSLPNKEEKWMSCMGTSWINSIGVEKVKASSKAIKT
jgi:hypothetical protein